MLPALWPQHQPVRGLCTSWPKRPPAGEGERRLEKIGTSQVFNRSRGHCLERQNFIEDLQNGPIRKNRDSSVSRTSGFEDSEHMMEPVHTANKSVNQGPKYNLPRTPGYLTSRHFHTQTQGLQQSERKFSQNQNIYQRGHFSPPGPHGEDRLHRRYSWNVKPNASQAAENRRWYPGGYYRLPYPTSYRRTK
ncbi:RNA/RNP complex-1-interacting phosphatase-like [Kogia breviceps]|uniref:RNA/RNP complex-1-interacting phosphatase-like n=1 Tax=Kogia breviceps TaxID=27615 RepID=UPI0034D1B5D2